MATKPTIKLRIPGRKDDGINKLDWEAKHITVSDVRSYTLGLKRGETQEQPVEETKAGEVV